MASSTLCQCGGCLRHITARRSKLCEKCGAAGCQASSSDPDSIFDEVQCKARKKVADVKRKAVS